MTGTWLKQPLAKVIINRDQRGPIIADDQGSRRGHQRSEISLTGDLSYRNVGAPPGRKIASLLGRKQMVNPLDQ